MLFAVGAWLFAYSGAQAQSLDRYSVRTVVIDPGHGGKDSGAIGVGKKTMEKDIVLPIALRLGALIEEHFPDVRVAYTRKDDTFVSCATAANLPTAKMPTFSSPYTATRSPKNAACAASKHTCWDCINPKTTCAWPCSKTL